MMELQVGDKVAVLDDDLEGEIVQIQNQEIVLETNEGFLLVYKQNELVKLGKPMSQVESFLPEDVHDLLKENEDFQKKKKKISRRKLRKEPPMEVDLHIHKLVETTRGMSNHDMLTLQLETAERQLKFAIQKRIQRVVFIHGVGEGVLKMELDYLLSRYDNVDFYDADYQKYGLGATEVFIFQNS